MFVFVHLLLLMRAVVVVVDHNGIETLDHSEANSLCIEHIVQFHWKIIRCRLDQAGKQER